MLHRGCRLYYTRSRKVVSSELVCIKAPDADEEKLAIEPNSEEPLGDTKSSLPLITALPALEVADEEPALPGILPPREWIPVEPAASPQQVSSNCNPSPGTRRSSTNSVPIGERKKPEPRPCAALALSSLSSLRLHFTGKGKPRDVGSFL